MTKRLEIRECLNKNSVQGGLALAAHLHRIYVFSDGCVVCLTDM